MVTATARATLRAEVESPQRVPLRRIVGLFRPYTGKVALLTLVVLTQAACSLASPFLIRAILDQALPQRNVTLLSILAGGMVAVALISSGLFAATTKLSSGVSQQVMHDLRVAVYTRLQDMSFGFFARTRTGDLQSRITNDIGAVTDIVNTMAASVLQSAATIVAVGVGVILLDWKLALITLIVIPGYLLLTMGVGRKRRAVVARRQARLSNLSSIVEESISVAGVLLAKTMGRQDELRRRFATESQEISNSDVAAAMMGRWRITIRRASLTLIPAIVYWIIGVTLAHNATAISIGTVVATVSLLNRMASPIGELQGIGLNMSTSMVVFGRIFEVLDLPSDIVERPDVVELAAVDGTVRLDDVSFSYEDDGAYALRHIDLTLAVDTTTAVVGHTGSGKTTLAYLVARLHEPTEGRILIDGTDLREFSFASWAKAVGFVSQETYLFHATIAENLRFAHPGATDEEIHRAASAARIHEHIRSLPEGYDTVVGERGYRFSGGERQRIAIARLLLRDPSIVILDEATSALDNETERAIQEALDELSRGRTMIAIAHRLSTIRNAKQIVVLDHGAIVERGTYEELIALDGTFAALSRETSIA